jgi:hypothetical protein
MNFSTTPPCRSTLAAASSKNHDISARSASGSSVPASSVNATTSQNNTVTVLRVSAGRSAISGAPHALQNSAPYALTAPQLAHTGAGATARGRAIGAGGGAGAETRGAAGRSSAGS